MQDPLVNWFNKTRNGKEIETGKDAKIRRKTKYMNVVDIAVYKGIRFETKQNLNSR